MTGTAAPGNQRRALRPEKQASSTFLVRLFRMINAAPATPAASVNAPSALGHASGEISASRNIETREDMANPILRKRDRQTSNEICDIH
jgi:hypothetical protein